MLANAETDAFLQMAGGDILPGMSGGPMLDLAQCGVVGLTQSTDYPTTNTSYGVPIDAALALWVEQGLRDINLAVDNDSLEALRRDQVELGKLPKRVSGYLVDAVTRFCGHLEDKYGIVPNAVGAEDLPEWVARQLFRLTLPQLVATLRNVMGDTFVQSARSLSCLSADAYQPRPVGWTHYWVSADSAARFGGPNSAANCLG